MPRWIVLRVRDHLSFGQRVIITAGLAAALAAASGYVIALRPGTYPASQGLTITSVPYSSEFFSGGGFFGQSGGAAPGWARLLTWAAAAALWSAAALFLLRGPRPARGPVSGLRVAAAIGLAAALGAGLTIAPGLASREALWLTASSGAPSLIIGPSSPPGWVVLLIVLVTISLWTGAALALLGGRPAEPVPEPADPR